MLIFAIVTIIIIRILAGLSIFRYPLWGTVASLIIDAGDIYYITLLFGLEIPGNTPELYHGFDKLFDTFYLSIAFYTSLKWDEPLAKKTSIVLFFYRLVGVVIFEITQIRIILFIFPNLFEHWFIFWAARNRYFSSFKLTVKKLVLILVLLAIPKMTEEYFRHFAAIPSLDAFIDLFR